MTQVYTIKGEERSGNSKRVGELENGEGNGGITTNGTSENSVMREHDGLNRRDMWQAGRGEDSHMIGEGRKGIWRKWRLFWMRFKKASALGEDC